MDSRNEKKRFQILTFIEKQVYLILPSVHSLEVPTAIYDKTSMVHIPPTQPKLLPLPNTCLP